MTLANEKDVADTFEVTRGHVHEVLRGRKQSVTILDILPGMGAENRKKGVRRQDMSPARCARKIEELRIEFMDGVEVKTVED